MKKIINELKISRQQQGLSQEALSQRLGMPQSHLSKLESGKTDPRLSNLLEWAHRLGLEVVLVPKELSTAIKAMAQGKPTNKPMWQIDEELDDE